MAALKEFANFITLNMANLVTTYARLLAEGGQGYEALPANSRTASGRKLLKAVVEAFELESATPLIDIFNKNLTENQSPDAGSGASSSQRSGNVTLPNPLLEVECLGQTLTPVVTNLEAGKFLWQILSETRAAALRVRVDPDSSSQRIDEVPQQVAEALSEDETFFQSLVDTLPQNIYRVDRAGRIIFGNKAFLNTLGMPLEESLGKTAYDLFPEELADKYSADDKRIIDSGEVFDTVESHQVPTTGQTEYVRVIKTPVKDSAGEIVGVQSIFWDVTERKQMEDRLGKRVRELNCLNEMGREMEASPLVPELLQWVTERIPRAMQYPELCKTAIQFEDEVYGLAEAIDLVAQMTHGLYIKGDVLGRVYIAYTEKHDFLDEESAMLGAIATRLSGYIENRWLLEETEAALAETETLAREQAVLNELGQALTTRLSVDQVLEEAYRQASHLVDTTNFYIGLYDPEKEEIAFRFDVSESVIDREILVMPASEGIAGHIVRNRTSLLFEDNVRQQQEALGITVVGQDALSWLGVPLIVGDQVLGVMAVQSFTTPGLYGVRDRELLTAIANQVAIALQNTRQFEETEATLTDVQQSQKLLRTIIDSTPDWIFIKDQEHRYRLANQAYADSLHLTAEDFVGKNDLELGFPEDIVKGSPEKGIRGFWADDREVMDRGETKLVEVEPAVVDGQTIFLRTVKVPLRDEEGQVWGVLGFVSNITEREQLLSELEHRARREQTIREITEQMRAATSLEQLLSITACELGQRLSAGHTLVKLGLESSVVEGQVDNGHSN